MENLEQKSDLSIPNDQEQTRYDGILYRIIDGMMRIRKTITDSQPTWYRDCGL
ncbi:MAG: hypothetical protein Q7R52_05430 [archaeon]|nr:hypothetical protein [archaeon]